MPDASDRLTKCFTVVFPDLAPETVRTAAPTTVAGWDSVAHVTLLAVVEEEFGTTLDADAIEELTSFDALLAAVSPA